MSRLGKNARKCLAFGSGLIAAGSAFAEGPAPTLNSGDTAWVLVSTALVLLMTPGLAFFYGGMVRTKHVVSTLFQSFVALGAVGIVWCVAGYSLAFSGDVGGFVGNLNWAMLNGVGQTPNADYAATIPHLLFMAFQCMFAVITPALITGALAERLGFKGWVMFAALWSLLVYAPIAHWVWGVGGWIRNLGGLDFAGGMVVHMSAGFSALVGAIVLKKRQDFGQAETRPYDTGFILLGTALLWFGWFGFNGGSALSANGIAVQAFCTTFFAAAAAGISWTLVDNFVKGKPSAAGFGIGVVVGLVAVTPASGFVSVGSSLIIGLLAGSICNFTAIFIKEKLKIDDSLDVFACHGVGGTLGTVLTPLFASKAVNDAGADGILFGNFAPMQANLLGAVAVAGFSMVATFVLIKVVGIFTALRVSDQDEKAGLDFSQHAEVINSIVAEPHTVTSIKDGRTKNVA